MYKPVEIGCYLPGPYQRTPNGPRGMVSYPNRYCPLKRKIDYQTKTQKSDSYNEEFWCETCDRSFPNLCMLKKHKEQHEKCNIDGCQFVAHPKVITKHIQMQHSSGLFKKIANLNNPEEIKKWIEERKRKYPTKNNIEKKAAEHKEKIDRGEKMGLQQHRNMRNYKEGGYMKRSLDRKNLYKKKRTYCSITKNKTSQNSNKPSNATVLSANKPEKIMPAREDNKLLKPFTGIRHLAITCDVESDIELEKCDDLIKDDDYFQQQLSNQPSVCSALSSLICNYGSSDEDTEPSDPKLIEQQFSKSNEQLQPKQQSNSLNIKDLDIKVSEKNVHNNQSDDDSGPDEIKVEKSGDSKMIVIPEETKIINVNKSQNVHCKKVIMKKRSRTIPSTLLQKLLHKEILNERNTVLQCIRHIIKQNYFQNS